MTDTQTIVCHSTQIEAEAKLTRRGNPRLPRGWKRIGDKVYSPDGWKQHYRLCAVIVPIAGPVIEESRLADEAQIKAARTDGWTRIRESLKESWVRSTELANWCLQTLLANDERRPVDGGKLPAMPPIYLYGQRDFIGWSQSANSVIRTVEATYRKFRGEMLGYGRRRLPDVRYPYPWPVHNQSWSLRFSEDGQNRPIVSFTIFGGRMEAYLRGGKRYRRQLAGLRQIASGAAVKGELSVYRKGDDILVKMVAYLPRKQQPERNGLMRVMTGSDSFIYAFNEVDERLFIVNGDRIRREIAKHQRWQQRFREDTKFEKRRPHRERKSHQQAMSEGAAKHRKRLDSFVKETAAQIANHAKRRGLQTIRFNDANKNFFGESFPYFALRDRLAAKCDEYEIEFVYSCESQGDEENAWTARKIESEES